MEPQIDYREPVPGGPKSQGAVDRGVHDCGLEGSLPEHARLRAAQINGCAYRIDMHTRDARAAGEKEQRLYALAAWREAPFYSPRERAALAWAEAVTRVSQTHVADEAYREARDHFSEKELVDLTMAVVVINRWNRPAISFRTPPGTYEPARR